MVLQAPVCPVCAVCECAPGVEYVFDSGSVRRIHPLSMVGVWRTVATQGTAGAAGPVIGSRRLSLCSETSGPRLVQKRRASRRGQVLVRSAGLWRGFGHVEHVEARSAVLAVVHVRLMGDPAGCQAVRAVRRRCPGILNGPGPCMLNLQVRCHGWPAVTVMRGRRGLGLGHSPWRVDHSRNACPFRPSCGLCGSSAPGKQKEGPVLLASKRKVRRVIAPLRIHRRQGGLGQRTARSLHSLRSLRSLDSLHRGGRSAPVHAAQRGARRRWLRQLTGMTCYDPAVWGRAGLKAWKARIPAGGLRCRRFGRLRCQLLDRLKAPL